MVIGPDSNMGPVPPSQRVRISPHLRVLTIVVLSALHHSYPTASLQEKQSVQAKLLMS